MSLRPAISLSTRVTTAAVLGGAALALPVTALGGYADRGPGASAAAPPPPRNVQAAGGFSGTPRFDPPNVSVRVGQAVRWRNTDSAAPHTATENHGLWNLTGTYGPPGSRGFGPGESRQRPFEAGTHNYFCKIHPDTMRGWVRVPVVLSKATVNGQRVIRVRWAPAPPPSNRVFDVQRRRGNGPWQNFRVDTNTAAASFGASAVGTVWRLRARLQKAGAPAAATGFSPPAQITS